jgi:HAD superfamily hydrolase (TIGR01509 family)
MFQKRRRALSCTIILWVITQQFFAAGTQQKIVTINNIAAEQQYDTIKSKPHTKYRNIIFDVGNVLLKSNPKKVISDVYAQRDGATIDINNILQFMSSDDWKKCDMGNITRKDLKAVFPAQLDREAFGVFLDLLPHSLTPLEEGIALLKTMKERGYHVYILSNMSKEGLEVIKQKYDFFKLCDGEIFSCNVHTVKPDTVMYLFLLKEYNLDPAECLFIDDVQENIDAAKAVGIDGIVCSSHAFVRDELKRLHVLN